MPEDRRDSIGRLRVSPETDAMLEAIKLGKGISKHDSAVRVLHEWAVGELDVSKFAHRLDPREGSRGTTMNKPGTGGGRDA